MIFAEIEDELAWGDEKFDAEAEEVRPLVGVRLGHWGLHSVAHRSSTPRLLSHPVPPSCQKRTTLGRRKF
jgi:hypothetical protein